MNPLGTVHGGVIAALLDTACGCAVHTTLPAGTGYTSLDLNTRFLRPVRAGAGRIRCVGTVLTAGSRTATAEAQDARHSRPAARARHLDLPDLPDRSVTLIHDSRRVTSVIWQTPRLCC